MRSEKQIADLETRVEQLEALFVVQAQTNIKLISMLQSLCEQDKTPQSRLILPDRLNS